MQCYKILKTLAAYVTSTFDNFSSKKNEVQRSEYNAIIDKRVHDLRENCTNKVNIFNAYHSIKK
jgi:hypothetical protein